MSSRNVSTFSSLCKWLCIATNAACCPDRKGGALRCLLFASLPLGDGVNSAMVVLPDVRRGAPIILPNELQSFRGDIEQALEHGSSGHQIESPDAVDRNHCGVPIHVADCLKCVRNAFARIGTGMWLS